MLVQAGQHGLAAGQRRGDGGVAVQLAQQSAAGIVVIPGGCHGLPRRFGCEGATCHRAIGAVNGSFAAQPRGSRPRENRAEVPCPASAFASPPSFVPMCIRQLAMDRAIDASGHGLPAIIPFLHGKSFLTPQRPATRSAGQLHDRAARRRPGGLGQRFGTRASARSGIAQHEIIGALPCVRLFHRQASSFLFERSRAD
jgi:hypothetical protein